jgi:hypothetical protein
MHRAGQRRAALRAAMSDVFKIAGCGTIGERRGLDDCDRHPLSAMWTGEHEARQARWRNVIVIHGTLSVPSPRPSRDQFMKESTSTKVYACRVSSGRKWVEPASAYALERSPLHRTPR